MISRDHLYTGLALHEDKDIKNILGVADGRRDVSKRKHKGIQEETTLLGWHIINSAHLRVSY